MDVRTYWYGVRHALTVGKFILLWRRVGVEDLAGGGRVGWYWADTRASWLLQRVFGGLQMERKEELVRIWGDRIEKGNIELEGVFVCLEYCPHR